MHLAGFRDAWLPAPGSLLDQVNMLQEFSGVVCWLFCGEQYHDYYYYCDYTVTIITMTMTIITITLTITVIFTIAVTSTQ